MDETSLTFDSKRYYDINCNEEDLEFHFIQKNDYSVGKATKFNNGMDGRELDLRILTHSVDEINRYTIFVQEDIVGMKFYLIYRVENKKLYFADSDRDKGLDGLTSVKRINVFNNEYYIKNN